MILICFGTRPEYLKVKPLFEAFKKENIPFKTVFTGQHDTLLNEVSFDWRLHIKNKSETDNRLNSVFTSVMKQGEDAIRELNPTYVLVQGDTTSAAAFAMSAYHMGVKIMHLEAGLRTYDRINPYPEEVNRQLISRIADIHFCPTKRNEQNLIEEKTEGQIFITGNTALDNIRGILTTESNKILITLHRRENHAIIHKWFKEIETLAILNPQFEFILPIHPNPSINKFKEELKGINVIDPLSHEELIKLLAESKLIITDSGGIQEEASFLRKPSIICRKTTERPESLGQSGFLCRTPKDLPRLFDSLINYKVEGYSPYGDGYSAEKIVHIINKLNI